MMLLHLLACSDWQLASVDAPATSAMADTDVDEPIADTDVPVEEEDTEPPEDTGCGEEVSAGTHIIIGTPEVDPSAGPAVCTDFGPVDFAFTTEWSSVVAGGFAMGPVVAPNRGAAFASIFLDIGEHMVELDGRDGATLESIDLSGYATSDDGSMPVVGDTNGDGALEFVRTDVDFLEVVDGATGSVTAFRNPAPHWDDEVALLADVDLDGAFEIVVPTGVFELDGTPLAAMTAAMESTGVFVSDLDADGFPEVVNGAGIWDPKTGTRTPWDASARPDYSFYGAPVDLGGVAGVVFTTGRDALHLGLFDGTLDWSMRDHGDRMLISAADATGDGVPDLCTTDYEDGLLYLVDVTGVVQASWARDTYGGGCTMADLDADGVYEVLHSGMGGFAILDGRTGAVLAEDRTLMSTARDSQPVVADVDGDGSAEIVLTTLDVEAGWETAVVVLGPASGRWARTRPVWNQLAYDVTSIRDDGSLVSHPLRAWEAYGVFRAQPSNDGAHPDLAVLVEAATVPADECAAAHASFDIDVRNQGSVDAPAGAVLRVSGFDGTNMVLVAEHTFTAALPAGEHVQIVITTEPEPFASGWIVDVVAVDEDDCDRVNDRAEGRW